MAIPTNLYRTIERAIGGDLEEYLRIRRAKDKSWLRIAHELGADHGIEVTPETLRQWADKLGLPTDRRNNGDKASEG